MTISKKEITVDVCHCDICGKDITNSAKLTITGEGERLDACLSASNRGLACYEIAELDQLIKSGDFAFCGSGNSTLNNRIKAQAQLHNTGCKYSGTVPASMRLCDCGK